MSHQGFQNRTQSRGNRITSIVGVLAIVLLMSVPSGASAYTFTGCKWPSANIAWSNQTSGTYSTAALAAGNRWSQLSDVNLSATGGNIRVYQSYTGADGYAGYSYWSCPYYGQTISAEARLNTYYADAYPTLKKKTVFVHEIGHAVGLHHSQYSNAVMYTCPACVYNNYYYSDPQSDDIAGMNARY